MIVETFSPSSALSSLIDKYVIVMCETERINRLLPGTSMAMTFRLSGHTEYVQANISSSIPSSVISGIRKTPRFVKYFNNSASLIVLFKSTGAAAFFNQPLHELFGDTISLDTIMSRTGVEIIEEKLRGAANNKVRIGIIEGFLMSKMSHSVTDSLVVNAVSKICDASGTIRISTLAKSLHISQDAFEKRFRKIVGSSAKQFSTIVRMKAAIKYKQNTTVTDMALNAGYFDSAHFNKDFKLFTSQTPKEFFSIPAGW